MKQTQTPPTPPRDDPQRMSLSSLWNLWVDNLKEWHFYLVEEHGHRQRADISGWIDKLRQRIRSFMTSLRRDVRHQKNASRHRKFPESDYGIAQFCPERKVFGFRVLFGNQLIGTPDKRELVIDFVRSKGKFTVALF